MENRRSLRVQVGSVRHLVWRGLIEDAPITAPGCHFGKGCAELLDRLELFLLLVRHGKTSESAVSAANRRINRQRHVSLLVHSKVAEVVLTLLHGLAGVVAWLSPLSRAKIEVTKRGTTCRRHRVSTSIEVDVDLWLSLISSLVVAHLHGWKRLLLLLGARHLECSKGTTHRFWSLHLLTRIGILSSLLQLDDRF